MPDRPPSARTPERQPTPGSTPDPGRERLRAALSSRPSRGQAVVGALLAVVGFAAMTQVQSNERENEYAGLRQADLIRVFEGLAASTERAENEIDRLAATRADLRSSTASRQAALEQARQQATTLGIIAGTIPATGPGVRITITDPRGDVDTGTLLNTIQELRAAGAESIEFNDRIRVVAQTSLEDTPAGIEVDGQLVEAPFVLDVIGEPTTLADVLAFPQGPRENVEDQGGTITAEELEQVLIESVVDVAATRFAEPQTDQ